MTEFTIVSADQLDQKRLEQFLNQVYGAEKGRFLHRHGTWWHRGDENRWATVTETGEVVAYCAIIPIRCVVGGESYQALWWVDLIVLPDYRGRGLQRDLDKKVREAAPLKLGFPNELAAKIHLKHGWGVSDNIRVMMMPLVPMAIRQVREASGVRGLGIRTGASILSIGASIARQRFAAYQPVSARVVDNPSAETLAGCFMRHNAGEGLITTMRDADFIRWRYLESPYRDELTIYTVGSQDAPSHVLITRTMLHAGKTIVRLIDMFGDFDDRNGMLDGLKLVRRDAVQQGAVQMMALASLPDVIGILHRVGFIIGVTGLFCWHSTDQPTMAAFDTHPHHWMFTDSDNDEPVV